MPANRLIAGMARSYKSCLTIYSLIARNHHVNKIQN
jgi:hypothetical protein